MSIIAQYLTRQSPALLLRRVAIATTTTTTTIHHGDQRRTFTSPTGSSSTGSSSSSSELVDTKLHVDKGIAEITMQNGSVNSLSLEM